MMYACTAANFVHSAAGPSHLRRPDTLFETAKAKPCQRAVPKSGAVSACVRAAIGCRHETTTTVAPTLCHETIRQNYKTDKTNPTRKSSAMPILCSVRFDHFPRAIL